MPRICCKTLIGIVLIVLGLSACASEQKLKRLDETLKLYQSTFRWSRFDDLQRFQRDVPPMDAAHQEKMKSIRVTSYEERQRIVTEDYMQAEQVVQIGYYNENTGIESRITDKQVWKFDADKQVWYLNSPLPTFSRK